MIGMDGATDAESSGINISDVIEVIKTDPVFGPTMMDNGRDRGMGETGPYIKIIEQPASKALRFRYECEGRSAGSIPGVNSTPETKTFPTIQIVGYKGRAVVVVSCVTKDPPYRPHPHNLVGREGCKKGVCTLEVNNETMTLSFANLGIQCVKKKDIEEALRVREKIRVDPFRTGFSHRTQPGSIDLNAVRLSFQAFLEGPEPGKFTVQLMPIVSETIYDKKAMSDLVICKLSDCSSSVAGGKEIILLCEKVAKEDISVRLYEERDGQLVWEGYGDFTPTQVHKQVAIAFRTPKYRNLEVEYPVQVLIQLKRPSDGATSESLPFQLTPLDSDPGVLKRKRQKLTSESGVDVLRHLNEPGMPPVADLSPGLAVKREPPETSPNPYAMFPGGGKLSPMYASRTPSPMDYTGYSPAYPVGMYAANINYPSRTTTGYSPSSPQQQVIERVVSPGNHIHTPHQGLNIVCSDIRLARTSPGLQTVVTAETYVVQNMQNIATLVSASNAGVITNGETSYLDMDSALCNIGASLDRLDSKDLAELEVLDAGNLSENLSSNLTLSETKQKPVPMNENMTDSLTRLATSAINEICSYDMYDASSAH